MILRYAARRFAYLLLIALISGWLPQAQVIAPLPAAAVAPAAPAGGARVAKTVNGVTTPADEIRRLAFPSPLKRAAGAVRERG
jgi:hypothetical protein